MITFHVFQLAELVSFSIWLSLIVGVVPDLAKTDAEVEAVEADIDGPVDADSGVRGGMRC